MIGIHPHPGYHPWDLPPKVRFAVDCLLGGLEGTKFEVSVPHEIGSGSRASSGLGPIDCRRGVSSSSRRLGKPIKAVCRRLEEPPLTAE